jgi:Tfp pilus assembly protein PilX
VRTRSSARSQRGVVLFVALIVLVAITLAGIALMRSVDTSVVISGNLAFKQTATQSSDGAMAQAFQWLNANSAGATLQNDNAAGGYRSSRPAAEPDWGDMANWTNAVVLNGGAADASGNVVRYVIHRMCTEPNTPYNGANAGVPNVCALSYPTSAAAVGGSMSVGASSFEALPQLYYRVTARVDGPRNTVSIVQASVLLPI